MPTLMELTLTQTYLGQVAINRWNYVASGTPAAVSLSFALVKAFGAIFDQTAVPPAYPPNTLLQAIRAVQSNAVNYQSIEARAIYSPTDFYTTGFAPALTGAATGEGMSPVLSFGFRSTRVRADIRRAQKRFVGVSENNAAGGGVITAATLALLDTIAQRMSQVLTYNDEGNTITFSPCVVGKFKYAIPGTSPVRYAYRYATPAEGGEAAQLQKTATGIGWERYLEVRSQVSRQYGRGI